MRGDVNVHHALLAAPKEVGAQAWPYTPRGRAALPAGESGAARDRPRGGLPPGPMVTLSRAKRHPRAAAGPRHCRFCTRERASAPAPTDARKGRAGDVRRLAIGSRVAPAFVSKAALRPRPRDGALERSSDRARRHVRLVLPHGRQAYGRRGTVTCLGPVWHSGRVDGRDATAEDAIFVADRRGCA
jgi:hypothetical protein